ncbi:unnamed protein product [Colias eurytheme]|nr:unnamed protein product [Colias eurytheme]
MAAKNNRDADIIRLLENSDQSSSEDEDALVFERESAPTIIYETVDDIRDFIEEELRQEEQQSNVPIHANTSTSTRSSSRKSMVVSIKKVRHDDSENAKNPPRPWEIDDEENSNDYDADTDITYVPPSTDTPV